MNVREWLPQPVKKQSSSGTIIFRSRKPEKLAKTLFRYDNDPGTKEVSGSQDSIGITMPGINRFFYDKGKYWPSKFETISDLKTIKWLEERLYMLTLWPRPDGYNVLSDTHINTENVRKLAEAADKAWDGLISMDFKNSLKDFSSLFIHRCRMFPKMMNREIEKIIGQYKGKARAWKLSGAGGGGYLIMISEEEIPNAFKIKIRVKDLWL